MLVEVFLLVLSYKYSLFFDSIQERRKDHVNNSRVNLTKMVPGGPFYHGILDHFSFIRGLLGVTMVGSNIEVYIILKKASIFVVEFEIKGGKTFNCGMAIGNDAKESQRTRRFVWVTVKLF